MKNIFLLTCWTLATLGYAADSLFQIKGFCIAAPKSNEIPDFVQFMENELATRRVNTLILRVDYNYEYQTHPELRDSSALTFADVKKIVRTAQKHRILLIPQINLLGHQSWHGTLENLLTKYPQFDETPHVQLPEKYAWPNADGLYCKSYCPLHPEVHQVVFDLVDEICSVFETNAFHAGMDEVFYLGDDKCPRCQGRDKAELFADEVRRIRDHLKAKNRELWIWGDRLIDGKNTGIGLWEASYNMTARAVDLIPKDVVICDWHYERPDQTPVYFAMKGLRVLTCPWNRPEVALSQTDDMARWVQYATREMKPKYYGMLQTVWTSFANFQKELKALATDPPKPDPRGRTSSADCFVQMFNKINSLEK
jgi:hypothetical protein